jgi:oligopeptide/dipeptide ABC transporter ATP-binding protein
MGEVLRVEGLQTRLRTRAGTAIVVDCLDLSLSDGETLAIVGESGCGKSMAALSIMRLVPRPPGEIAGGRVLFRGRDLLPLPEGEMRKVRGRKIAMIFQDPMTSLNPILRIGTQLLEVIHEHEDVSRGEALERVGELLRLVRIPDPERVLDEYPHRLSGGMRQRVMIAMALACNPELLIADEPTTALDVTVQAQILALLADIQKRLGLAMLLITHNLGVVAENAERVLVMYAGRIVEEGPVERVFQRPLHPYTRGLLAALPAAGTSAHEAPLREISGMVPPLAALPSGCSFAPRCPQAVERCRAVQPEITRIGKQAVACLVAQEMAVGSGER